MKTLIIAEAGVNHNGSIEMAKQLIDVAVSAGADIVKFQTFIADKLVSADATMAEYQVKNTGSNDKQINLLKSLELSKENHLELIAYCKQKNIQFLSTAFDLESLDLLIELGIKIFKIPSGELTNLPFVKKIGSLKKQVILSTGMASLSEVEAALNVLVAAGTEIENITVLQCTTEYPAPFNDVNLLAMKTMAEKFNCKVGYSDHTLGVEVSVAAVALGASIIEKHFTLNKELPGPDHKASLEPAELGVLIKCIRNIEAALGNGVKAPAVSEIKNMAIARKSIHIKAKLSAGHVLVEADLEMKRPGDGISPMQMEKVIGKELLNDMLPDTKLKFEDLK